MKIMCAKPLITTGKMPAVQMVKMNIFGQWLLTNYMAQTQAAAATARNLLLNLAQQRQPVARKKLQRNNQKII